MSIPRRAGSRRRGLVWMALTLAAAVLVPAAIAMACSPQAYLTLDKATYGPGDTVRVSGSFFKASTDITVSLDRTGQSVTAASAGNGAFSTSFVLPASAPTGGYTVSAIGYESTGEVINGLPARGSFIVATPVAASAPTAPADASPQASTPAAAAPQASTPAATADQSAATRPTQRPSTGTTTPTWREPAVISEPDVQSSTTRRSTHHSTATGTGRATANGRAVFGGSVAPAVSASPVTAPAVAAAVVPTTARSTGNAGAHRSTAQPAKVSPQAAEQTSADDVWGSVSSGRSPSVLPVAGDGASVSSPRAGSQLALGILLLGGGALALVGGFAFGEARRRRVSVR